jgi:hypothetical protein
MLAFMAAIDEFVARLCIDRELRSRFLLDPAGEALRLGLDAESCRRLAQLDRPRLQQIGRDLELNDTPEAVLDALARIDVLRTRGMRRN